MGRPVIALLTDFGVRDHYVGVMMGVNLGVCPDATLVGKSFAQVGREPTYEEAGVSLATADAVVERLRAAVESTGTEGFGAFAGLYPLDDRRLLAASMDSIGVLRTLTSSTCDRLKV